MKKLNSRLKETKREERIKQDRTHLDQAMDRIGELEAHVKAIKKLEKRQPIEHIKPRQSDGNSEATVIAVATDWHMGERFSSEQVNDMNEYNVALCKQRGKMFFERVVRLANKERQDVNIDELVLFLGGDLIDGALHMDTIMANELAAPMTQAVEMQALIEAGLCYIRDHGNFKRITLVCADGNHGRITNKQHFSSRRGNALEYYMYYNLAQRYPEFNWIIRESMLTYLRIYDSTIRFMHGDRIAFGGVNGFYTYLHRRIFEWDTTIKADYTILGHLHQYTPNRRYLVNGSLVGYSPFAVALGAKYEPAIQSFMLWDKKRGPTVQIPILF